MSSTNNYVSTSHHHHDNNNNTNTNTTHNVCEFLNRREWNSEERKRGGTSSKYDFLRARRLPSTFREHCLTTESFDKVFTAHWLSSSQVIIGTKCNQLYVEHVTSGKRIHIPLIGMKADMKSEEWLSIISNQQLPLTRCSSHSLSSPIASRRTPYLNSPINNRSRESRLPNLGFNESHSMRTGARRHETIEQAGITAVSQEMGNRLNRAGIHTISLNPSKSWLATGATESYHIGIYRLPSFRQYALCLGHIDWLFATEWLTDTILVSGSRDSSIAMWNIVDNDDGDDDDDDTNERMKEEDSIRLIQPVVRRFKHKGKIRDLKYNRKTKDLATLSTDGTVKCWSIDNLQVKNTIHLKHINEIVCMNVCEERNLFAVGTQSHISLVDPRMKTPFEEIESLDEGHGVRSIEFREQILSVGGGQGRISFYDMRMNHYLDLDEMHNKKYLTTGDGWLNRDPVYRYHFQNMDIHNAVYTHKYNSTGNQLLVGGGPLQLGLCGSYAAIWS